MALLSEDDKYYDFAKEVFIEFARFEYCLKATGFLKNNSELAESNWDKFSNCTEMKKFFGDIKSKSATTCCSMHYILKNPPKKQIVKDGRLSWGTPPCINSSQCYFGAVRRVRNNLFHGGKFNSHFFEPERSAKLLKGVLCVLKCARQRHNGIAEAYDLIKDY